MKINSVQLMREIRESINQQINGMTWEEEDKYLKENIDTFDALLNKKQMSSHQTMTNTSLSHS